MIGLRDSSVSMKVCRQGREVFSMTGTNGLAQFQKRIIEIDR